MLIDRLGHVEESHLASHATVCVCLCGRGRALVCVEEERRERAGERGRGAAWESMFIVREREGGRDRALQL